MIDHIEMNSNDRWLSPLVRLCVGGMIAGCLALASALISFVSGTPAAYLAASLGGIAGVAILIFSLCLMWRLNTDIARPLGGFLASAKIAEGDGFRTPVALSGRGIGPILGQALHGLQASILAATDAVLDDGNKHVRIAFHGAAAERLDEMMDSLKTAHETMREREEELSALHRKALERVDLATERLEATAELQDVGQQSLAQAVTISHTGLKAIYDQLQNLAKVKPAEIDAVVEALRGHALAITDLTSENEAAASEAKAATTLFSGVTQQVAEAFDTLQAQLDETALTTLSITSDRNEQLMRAFNHLQSALQSMVRDIDSAKHDVSLGSIALAAAGNAVASSAEAQGKAVEASLASMHKRADDLVDALRDELHDTVARIDVGLGAAMADTLKSVTGATYQLDTLAASVGMTEERITMSVNDAVETLVGTAAQIDTRLTTAASDTETRLTAVSEIVESRVELSLAGAAQALARTTAAMDARLQASAADVETRLASRIENADALIATSSADMAMRFALASEQAEQRFDLAVADVASGLTQSVSVLDTRLVNTTSEVEARLAARLNDADASIADAATGAVARIAVASDQVQRELEALASNAAGSLGDTIAAVDKRMIAATIQAEACISESLSESDAAISQAAADVGIRLGAASDNIAGRLHAATSEVEARVAERLAETDTSLSRTTQDIGTRLSAATHNIEARVDAALTDAAAAIGRCAETVETRVTERIAKTEATLSQTTTDTWARLTETAETVEQQVGQKLSAMADAVDTATTAVETRLTARMAETDAAMMSAADALSATGAAIEQKVSLAITDAALAFGETAASASDRLIAATSTTQARIVERLAHSEAAIAHATDDVGLRLMAAGENVEQSVEHSLNSAINAVTDATRALETGLAARVIETDTALADAFSALGATTMAADTRLIAATHAVETRITERLDETDAALVQTAQHVKARLMTAAEQVQTSLVHSIGDVDAKLSEAVTGIGTRAADAIAAEMAPIRAATSDHAEWLRASLSHMRLETERLSEAQQAAAAVRSLSAAAEAQLRGVSESFAAKAESMTLITERAIHEIEHRAQNTAKRLDDIGETADRVAAFVGNNVEPLLGLIKKTRATLDDIDALETSQLLPAMRRVQSGLSDISDQMAARDDAVIDRTSRIVGDQIASAVEALGRNQREQSDQMQAIETGLSAIAARKQIVPTELVEQIADWCADQLGNANNRLADAETRISDQLANFGTSLAALVAIVPEQNSGVESALAALRTDLETQLVSLTTAAPDDAKLSLGEKIERVCALIEAVEQDATAIAHAVIADPSALASMPGATGSLASAEMAMAAWTKQIDNVSTAVAIAIDASKIAA
jgi:Apolipoprotein A1/A4/E domain